MTTSALKFPTSTHCHGTLYFRSIQISGKYLYLKQPWLIPNMKLTIKYSTVSVNFIMNLILPTDRSRLCDCGCKSQTTVVPGVHVEFGYLRWRRMVFGFQFAIFIQQQSSSVTANNYAFVRNLQIKHLMKVQWLNQKRRFTFNTIPENETRT